MPVNFVDETTDYLSYLPSVLQEIREFQTLAQTVNEELNLFKQAINEVFNEQFIIYADKTLEMREKEYNIIFSSDETIGFRRERLLERKRRKPPITTRSLEDKLNRYTDTTNVDIALVPGEYAFTVSLPAVDGHKFRDIQQLVHQLKPANMEYLQNPFSVETIRVKEISTEIKLAYSRAGKTIVGKSHVAETLSQKVVYER